MANGDERRSVVVLQRIPCRICNSIFPENSSQWVRACLCYNPVHRYCILHILRTHDLQYPLQTLRCSQCATPFNVVPTKGPVVVWLESFTYHWYPLLCTVSFCGAVYFILDATLATLGLQVLRLYGVETAHEILQDLDPASASSVCSFIPLVSFYINMISWEDMLLNALYRFSRLPVVGRILGKTLLPVNLRVPNGSDILMRALTLPPLAVFTGELLFSRENFIAKRLQLGGLFVLAVRGVFHLYYRQKNNLRRRSLQVANYSQQYRQLTQTDNG